MPQNKLAIVVKIALNFLILIALRIEFELSGEDVKDCFFCLVATISKINVFYFFCFYKYAKKYVNINAFIIKNLISQNIRFVLM